MWTLWTVIVLAGVVLLIAIARTVLAKGFPFFQGLNSSTREAYAFIAIAGGLAFAALAVKTGSWQLTAFDVGGLKGEIGKVQKQVQTVQSDVDQLAKQIERIYASQVVEIFNKANWGRLRFREDKKESDYFVEVPLKQEPIPGSMIVTRGSLAIPTPFLRIEGNRISFETYSNTFDDDADTIVVIYQPRPKLQNIPHVSK
jgi:hypothetical protein